MKKSPQFVIGGFTLTVDSYAANNFKRSIDYRWEGQDRISQPTAHQFIGIGVEQFSLSGTAHPVYKGRMYELNSIRSIAEKGKPVVVTTGAGQNLGKFVIIKVDEDFGELMDDHRARTVGWSIELKKYGED